MNLSTLKKAIVAAGAESPRLVYGIVLLLTLLLGAQIPRIQVDTDPENMLPEQQSDRVFHNRIKEEFSLHDAIIVGVVDKRGEQGIYRPETLADIHTLTEAILGLDGVIRRDLMSLSTVDNIEQAGPGTVSFSWLMNQPPENAAGAAELREQVERLPMLMDTLVSGDGKAAAIYVPIESKDESYRISQEIQAEIDALESGAEFHITGLPVAEDTFGVEMFVQMGISAPMAALVIFLLMWLFFRNLRLVTAPMIVAMATVIMTMGLLIGLGFTVHIMSSMIPIFLMPIAVVDSIHILSEFADTYHPGADRRKVIGEVVDDLFRPMLYTSTTSAVGFLSLALTPIPPVQVFGVFVAVGILLAFVLTIVFMPAYVCRMSEESLKSLQDAHHADEGDSVLARGLRRMGATAVGHSGKLLLALAVVLGVSVVGILKIQINDNPVRWFKEGHRIRVADRVLNEHFAGTYDAYFVLEHQSDPELANRLARELETLEVDGAAAEALANAADTLRSSSQDELPQALNRAISELDDASWEASGSDADRLVDAMDRLEDARQQLGYFLQPEAQALIERLQTVLQDADAVGKTNALPDLVRTINRELRSGEPEDFRIPDSRAGVAQALLQFQSSHRPQDLWRLVTPDYSSAVIWLQLSSGDNQDMSAVMAQLAQALEEQPLPEDITGRWAGKTYINVVWQEAMVEGMLKSLLGAFVIVFLMMVVLFRSPVYGVAAMLPLTVTITFIYGLIGWVGKDYDMPIAVLSALTLGLSIDFAIHFLDRSRALHQKTGDWRRTLELVFEEPSRAIARNAIVIAVGFLPLLFAPLVPYITVGFFLATIMAVSGVVTLLMLPALGRRLKRWMYPDGSASIEEVSS